MVRARARRWLAMAFAGVVTIVAQPASAATVEDRAFALGPLDLHRLTATKHDATAPIRLWIRTYGNWDADLLAAGGENRLYVLFNPDREGRADFRGEILFVNGELRMRIRDRQDNFVRSLRVYHPEPNLVKAIIPRGLPNPDGHAWLAASMHYVTATGPCAAGCFDRVPDEGGWLKLTPGQ